MIKLKCGAKGDSTWNLGETIGIRAISYFFVSYSIDTFVEGKPGGGLLREERGMNL